MLTEDAPTGVVLFSRQEILDCIKSGESLPSTTTERLSIALFWLYCDQGLQTPVTVTFLPSSTGIGTVGQKKPDFPYDALIRLRYCSNRKT